MVGRNARVPERERQGPSSSKNAFGTVATLSVGHAEHARAAPKQPISLPNIMDPMPSGDKIKYPQIATFSTDRFLPCIAWISLSLEAAAARLRSTVPPVADNLEIGPEPASRTLRHLAGRAVDLALPDHNPAGVVYGTLLIGAVLATESVRRETLVRTLAATGLALVVYWLAHAYSATLGDRVERQIPLTADAFGHALVRDLAIVRGAAVPMLALLIASAAGASLDTAVVVAVWTSAVSIFVFEFVAGIRAALRDTELLLQVLAGAVMGLAIIALRAVLH
jgi:hypothetical protein